MSAGLRAGRGDRVDRGAHVFDHCTARIASLRDCPRPVACENVGIKDLLAESDLAEGLLNNNDRTPERDQAT